MTEKSKAVLLHIGTPKTGSTSIQESLALARRTGNLGGVRYPLWRSDHHHSRLATLYRPYEELWQWWRQEYPANNRRFQRMRRQFRGFLFGELEKASNAIISWEGLSGLSDDHVGQLRRDLESVGFREFYIVLYIRDPADMYLSSSQQLLKAEHGSQSVKDPEIFRYQFLRAAETWEQVFPGSLLVRRFPVGISQDVVDDFAGLLNRYFGVSLPRPADRLNTTLSAEGMQILQDYRQTFESDNDGFFTPDTARLTRFLEQAASDLPQTRPALKPEIAERIRANHRADAEKIRARYGVDLGLSHFSAPPLPAHPSSYRVDEIVQSVDPELVHQLLLRLARKELGRHPAQRPYLVRMAARAYSAIPDEQMPPRLDGWLRAFVNRRW